MRRTLMEALGAFALVFAGSAALSDKPADLGATVPSLAVGPGLLYEIVLTALLMFVITAMATDTRAVGAAAVVGPIAGAAVLA